jgi:hypothetical protein
MVSHWMLVSLTPQVLITGPFSSGWISLALLDENLSDLRNFGSLIRNSNPWPLPWWQEATIPHGSKMYRFQQKLKNFKQRLKLWNKKNFGNIFEAQRSLNDQMKLLHIQIRNQGLTEKLKEKEALIKK